MSLSEMLHNFEKNTTDDNQSNIEEPESPETPRSPPRRGSNFPSLMSKKLKKTMSNFGEASNVSRESIQALLKTTLKSYSVTPHYIGQLPCNLTCQSLISNAINFLGHEEAIKKKCENVVVNMVCVDYVWRLENDELTRINNSLEKH